MNIIIPEYTGIGTEDGCMGFEQVLTSTITDTDTWTTEDTYPVGNQVNYSGVTYSALSNIGVFGNNIEVISMAKGLGSDFVVVGVADYRLYGAIGTIVDHTAIMGEPFLIDYGQILDNGTGGIFIEYDSNSDAFFVIYPVTGTDLNSSVSTQYRIIKITDLTLKSITDRKILWQGSRVALNLIYTPHDNKFLIAKVDSIVGYISNNIFVYNSINAPSGYTVESFCCSTVSFKTVAALKNTTDWKTYCSVVTANQTSISFGTPVKMNDVVVIGNSSGPYKWDFDQNSDVLICSTYEVSTNRLHIRSCYVSDSSVVFGTSSYTKTSYSKYIGSIWDNLSASVVFLYCSSVSGVYKYGSVFSAKASTNTITFGSVYNFPTGRFLNSTKMIYNYDDGEIIYSLVNKLNELGGELKAVSTFKLNSSGVVTFNPITWNPKDTNEKQVLEGLHKYAAWSVVSVTNKYAMFDGFVNTETVNHTETYNYTQYSVNFNRNFTHICFLNIFASKVRISAKHENGTYFITNFDTDITSDPSYTLSGKTNLVIQLPTPVIYSDTVEIRFTSAHVSNTQYTGNLVSVGMCIIGNSVYIGDTQYGLNIERTDYSVVETNEWGVSSITKRPVAKYISCDLFITKQDYDFVSNVLDDIRSTPVVWIPTDDTVVKNLTTFGFYNRAKSKISMPNDTVTSIEIQGLI